MGNIRNITVSGRIASGTTTLARGIATKLGWSLLEGGALFEKYFDEKKGNDADRDDSVDLEYEEMIKQKLKTENNQVIQSHLAGFDAQGVEGVFKILVVCEDKNGKDKTEVRVDRLINRKGISGEEAKKEIKLREEENLKKWRRLYADNDQTWVYWDKKYYDLVVNTYELNKDEAIKQVLNILQSK